MAEVGLWRGVKGLTPIALSWKKDTHFTETSVVNFPVCVFVRRANFNFVFGDNFSNVAFSRCYVFCKRFNLWK